MSDKPEPEVSEDDTRAVPGKARFVKPLAWVLGTTMIAATVSVLTMPGPATPDPEPAVSASQTKPTESTEELRPELKPATALARARRALREGNAAMAYQDFQKFASNTDKTIDQNLLFEISLSCESVGKTATASRLYEKLAVSGNPKLETAARLGLARVHFRDARFQAVETLLAPALVADEFAGSSALTAEGEYLRALALANTAIPEQRMSLLQDRGLVGGDPKWSVQDILADLRVKQQEPGDGEKVLQIRGKGIEAVVSIQLQSAVVRQLIDEIVLACGLKTTWSRVAQQAVRRQLTDVRINQKSASVVLDLLSSEIDLVWLEKDGRIRIKSGTEATVEEQNTWNRERARRSLWGAITAYPESRLAPFAVLALGNLDAMSDPVEAMARYDESLRQTRVAPVRLAALFNRSKVAMRQNQWDEAISGFDAAAQFGNGTVISAVSLLYHAKLKLETGNHKRAISPLLRAIAYLDVSTSMVAKAHRWTDRDEALASAAHTLSVAWLMNENPLAANENLMRHRKVLGSEKFRDATAFLTAIAAYRLTKTESQRLAEGRTLVASLTRVAPSMLFTAAGTALIGSAWNDLGLSAQMASVYEKQLPNVRAPWLRKHILHSLAEYHLTVRDEKRIQQLLLELKKIAEDDATVEIALAEQSVRLGRSDVALKQCRALLQNQQVDKVAVLDVMGQAYERTGDYRNAALCFAGMLPRVAAKGESQ